MRPAPRPNPTTLRKLYEEEGLAISQIAIVCGVSKTTAHGWLKHDGVPSHPARPPTVCEMNSGLAKWIAWMYADCGVSGVELARKLGTNTPFIYKVLRQIGAERKTSSEAAAQRYQRANGDVVVQGLLKEILDGELLGDGHLTSGTWRSSRFTYATAKRQYVQWLAHRLKEFGMEGGKVAKNPNQNSFRWSSKAYPSLKALRNLWYSDCRKTIPRAIQLTPTVCLHWYIGDGSINTRRSMRSIYLATCGFSWEDNEFLRDALQKIVGSTSIYKKKFPFAEYPYLYLTKAATLNFLDYIGPCPEEIRGCYGYKWAENQRTKAVSFGGT